MLTEADIRAGAEATPYSGRRPPRLSAIAEWVNANLPEWTAKVEPWSYRPDKAPQGATYRIDGRTRKGNRFTLYPKGRETFHPLFWHNSMEPYHHNSQVCRRIVDILDGRWPDFGVKAA
jgi:hypothetical protein